MSSGPQEPGFSMPQAARRSLLVLCLLFGVWCAYLMGTRLREPAANEGRIEAISSLEGVHRILAEAMEQQGRQADFQEGSGAALARLQKLRAAYGEAHELLAKKGPQSEWARRNVPFLESWAAALTESQRAIDKPADDAGRRTLEAELRARGQLMMAELRTTIGELKNPPFEAFLAERRQAAMIALAALCLVIIVALYLVYEEWVQPGSPVRAVSSLTAMPWAEEALKNLPEGILTLDEQLRVRWANHAAGVLLGYRESELEGLHANAIFPATSSRGGAAGFVAQNGRLTETARKRDGSSFMSRFHVVRTPQRTMVLFRQFIEERVEQGPRPAVDVSKLKEDNEVLNDLLRNAPWPLAVFDHKGCISRLNVAAEELLDFSAGEVKGHPYWEMLLPESEWNAAAERWAELHATHKAQVVEEPWRPRFGDQIPLRWSRAVLLDRNGQMRFVIGAADRIVSAAPAGGPAAAAPVMSEELEDRLTEVIGYAELALLSSSSQDDARSDLERVRNAAEKAIGAFASGVRN